MCRGENVVKGQGQKAERDDGLYIIVNIGYLEDVNMMTPEFNSHSVSLPPSHFPYLPPQLNIFLTAVVPSMPRLRRKSARFPPKGTIILMTR